MATTVIKKQKTTDVATANISHDEIEGYDNGKVIVLTSAVKQAVNIKFDKYLTHLKTYYEIVSLRFENSLCSCL